MISPGQVTGREELSHILTQLLVGFHTMKSCFVHSQFKIYHLHVYNPKITQQYEDINVLKISTVSTLTTEMKK